MATPAFLRGGGVNTSSGGVETLSAIGAALRRKVRSDVSFKLVRTRVFIRTGIDLDAVDRRQDSDPAAVTKVLDALRECGHALVGVNGTGGPT